MPAVSGLEAEFPGQVVAQNVDASTPQSRRAVEELGFIDHGLVIRGSKGEALWKQPDHDVNVDDVRNALKKLLQ